jgi:uncharacterized protein (TIGR03118 family)
MKIHRTMERVFVAALLLCGCAAAARGAQRAQVKKVNPVDKTNNYAVTILVSDEPDEAPVLDPKLVNAWGIAAGPTTFWWVANNGTDSSTLYNGDGDKQGLEVSVPGAPTGIVFNTSSQFQIQQGNKALFLFVSESGSFLAWNPATGTSTFEDPVDPGHAYKGLAIHGDVLYTTDFTSCEVEAFAGNFFDGSFDEFDTAGGFEDDSIPAGFCPFGIQAVGNSIFVTYAKKAGIDDVAGVGNGFVREFDPDGNLIARVANHGLLNSPWGVTMAPDDFGKFSGCLLVGNFGDGKINAFCQNPAGNWHHAGRLREGAHPLVIDGLWGIAFGNNANAGDDHTLFFAAGPDEEEHGYFGKVEFVH